MERSFRAILSSVFLYQWKFSTLSQKAVVIIFLTQRAKASQKYPYV